MLKRTLCLILSAITILSVSVCSVATAAEPEETTAEYVSETDDGIIPYVTSPSDGQKPIGPEEPVDETMALLASLVKKFPAGKYWNHMGSKTNSPDTYTNTPCASHKGCSWAEGACSCNSFDRSIQCMGYAHKIAYDITGASPRDQFKKYYTLNVNNLRVGDVIRFRNNGHSICVTGVSGTKISFTDCNWDYKCGIRWGVMDISYIKSRGFTYVLHLEGNDRKNTDLYFFEHLGDYEEKIPENAEVWVMSDSNLNVRDKASTSGKKVGTIPAGSTFYVTEKVHTDDYLWGYVYCNGIKGWAALNYSEYESGTWQTPDITNAENEYVGYKLSFSWNAVDGASYYLFRLYDESKKVIKQFNVYGATETELKVDGEGKYYAKVYSRSKHNSSWVLGGKLITFNVKAPEPVKITGISLPATFGMAYGESKVLEAAVEPADNTEELKWESSAPEIVSVEDGTLKALSCGKATVYCKNPDGTVSASCTVTVTPENVTNIAVVAEETKTDCITFTWNAISYADSYDIHRYNAETKKYVKIGTSKIAKYTDKTAEEGHSYYYLVRACDKTESGTFRGANTKVKLASRPPKVTGLTQNYSSTGKIRLVWDEAQNATVYVVYKYDSANKKYIKVSLPKETTVTLTVAPGEGAYYRVYAATKANGKYLYSAASDKVYTLAGPEKAVVTASSTNKGTATVSWDACTNVYRYYVFRYTGSAWERIAILRSDVTEYTDTELKSGENYTYRVRAVSKKAGKASYGAYSENVTVKVK